VNKVYKYKDESLMDVVIREYGAAEALLTVWEANDIPLDSMDPATILLPEFTPDKPIVKVGNTNKELQQKVTVEAGQVLEDIAIQHYGTAEVMPELFEHFGGLINPVPGEVLTMPVIIVDNKQNLLFFRNKKKVASQTKPINIGSDMAILAQGDYYIKATNGQYIKFR
jgi:LysM repeat protein